MNRSRRFFLGGIGALLAAGPVGAAAPQTSLRPQMRFAALQAEITGGPEGLVDRAKLSGKVACSVADTKTGLVLETLHGDLALPPASVAKALTALYALETLGAGYRFKTRLLTNGVIHNGVLSGDLILAGGGDPSLDTDDLAAMAAQLKLAGVRQVTGGFVVQDGALPFTSSIDATQADYSGYSPAVSGIALNFNRVHFEWKRAGQDYTISMEARARKFRPAVAVSRMQVVDRSTPVYTYASDKGGDQWTVARRALGKEGARWLPVRRPGDYVGDVFRTLAAAQDIKLKVPKVVTALPAGARVLVEHQSGELSGILRDMLNWSNNLIAEMIGMTATAARVGRPDSIRASARQMNAWAAERYGMVQTNLVDHSGLGDESRMTAADLVTALVQVRRQGHLRPMLKEFTLRDAQGRPNKGHPIKVYAKTGTLNFVSGLGGFMTGPDGTELAFAIFSADADTREKFKATEHEIPPGARNWNRRAKNLQQKLIERWGVLYCT
ncbi:D-alanyl-D-alanine carboxypeptidase/D-alanyl-D-alanine endopeptidase [Pontibaca salina]|nr:D-alanyl-D-alanine carboxypeptidase/D-alanyl-D-alanine-endopeptidase [Pontibaca salina]